MSARFMACDRARMLLYVDARAAMGRLGGSIMIETKEFPAAVVAAVECGASLSRSLPEHRQQLEGLHENALVNPSNVIDAQGGATTDKISSISIGIAKVTVTQKDESYRSREALALAADDVDAEGATWRTLRPTATLKSARERHGRNLLAFDTRKVDVSVEFLSIEVYAARSKSVRALVRGG
jgi:hypothetical protein